MKRKTIWGYAAGIITGVTFIAILFLCNYDSSQPVRWEGLILAFLSIFAIVFMIARPGKSNSL